MLHQRCRICGERHPLGPCPRDARPRRGTALVAEQDHINEISRRYVVDSDPERVEVVDPSVKPPEAAIGETADDGAGGDSETEARLTGGSGSAMPLSLVEAPTEKPVPHGGVGGSPAPKRKRGARGSFDRTAYQREFMRKKRRDDYVTRLQGMTDEELEAAIDRDADLYTLACDERSRRRDRVKNG